MNTKQRMVVIAVGAITMLMFLFPPYRVAFGVEYHFIGWLIDIDFYRYCINWMTLITLGTLLYIWFKDKP